jgi:rod shape-determining protein MreD
MTSHVRVPPVLLVAVVLHTALFPELRVFGVAADFLLLVTISTAIVGGPDRGALMGFACGLLADCFLQTPFGLSALAYCLVGWFVGVFQSRVLHAVWWIPVLTAAVATAAGTLAFVGLGAVVGQDQLISTRLPTIVAVTALWSAVLVPFTVRLMRWSLLVDSARAGLVLR